MVLKKLKFNHPKGFPLKRKKALKREIRRFLALPCRLDFMDKIDHTVETNKQPILVFLKKLMFAVQVFFSICLVGVIGFWPALLSKFSLINDKTSGTLQIGWLFCITIGALTLNSYSSAVGNHSDLKTKEKAFEFIMSFFVVTLGLAFIFGAFYFSDTAINIAKHFVGH